MRHLRPITAILAIAAFTVACGGPPAASAGGQSSQGSEASQGAGASEPVASTVLVLVVLHDAPPVTAVVGAGTVLAGLLVIARKGTRGDGA